MHVYTYVCIYKYLHARCELGRQVVGLCIAVQRVEIAPVRAALLLSLYICICMYIYVYIFIYTYLHARCELWREVIGSRVAM